MTTSQLTRTLRPPTPTLGKKPWTETGFVKLDEAIQAMFSARTPDDYASRLSHAFHLSVRCKAVCMTRLSRMHVGPDRNDRQPDAVFDLIDFSLQQDELAFICAPIISLPAVPTDLLLGYNSLGDDQARSLGELLSNPQSPLRSLSLFSCQLSDNGLVTIAESLLTNRSLKSLNIVRNQNPGGLGLSALANALKVNTTLETLALDVHQQDHGFTELCEALSMHPGVQGLRVTLRGAEASKALGALLATGPLKRLELDCLGDGESIWDGIANSSNLVELDVCRGDFGPTQAQALARLLRREDCRLCSVKVRQCTAGAEDCGPTLDVVREAMSSNQSLTNLFVASFRGGRDQETNCLADIQRSAENNARRKKSLYDTDAARALGCVLAAGGHQVIAEDCRQLIVDAVGDEVALRRLLAAADLPQSPPVNSPGSP
jgi:hypothetical protein